MERAKSDMRVGLGRASPALTIMRGGLVAAMSVATIALMIIGSPFPRTPDAHWYPLALFTVAGVTGWLSAVAWPGRVPGGVVLALVLLVGASLVTTLASAYPTLSVPASWDIGMKAGIALLLCQVAASAVGRRLLVLVALTILSITVVLYLLQVLGLWQQWLALGMSISDLPLRPAVTGGIAWIPTWLADYVLLLAPLVVVSLARDPPVGRILGVVVAAGSLAAVVISGTRSLWLIAGAFAVVGVLAWLRGHRARRAAVVLGVAILTVGVLTFVLGLGGKITRDLDEGRSSAFASAIGMFVRSPFVGAGPGTYEVRRLGDVVSVFGHYAFPNSHDLVLTTLGEAGLIGLGALALSVVLLGRAVRSNWRRSPSGRPIILAAVAGAGIALVHAMVDVVIEVPGLLFLLLLVAALALTPERTEAGEPAEAEEPAGPGRWTRRSVSGRALAIVALSGLLALAPALVTAESAIQRRIEADELAAVDPVRARAAAADAVRLAPDSAPALNALAVLEDRLGNTAAAIATMRRLVNDEALTQHRVELAILLDRAGRTDDALAEIRAALRRDRLDPFVQLNGAIILDRHGDDSGATDALANLIAAQPLIGLVAGALPGGLAADLAPATVRAIAELEAADRWDDALTAALAGDVQEAAGVVAAAPTGRHELLAAALAVWTDPGHLIGGLQEMLAANPGDAQAVRWGWLLNARRCDVTQRNRWGQVGFIATGLYPTSPTELGQVPAVEHQMRPSDYPDAVWRLWLPSRPYVFGTWTYGIGDPEC